MAISGSQITNEESQEIHALLCELDDQVNYVSSYTWQQRERKDCAFKATKKDDPDNPSMKEAISGEHQGKFWTAMLKEIDNLRNRNT